MRVIVILAVLLCAACLATQADAMPKDQIVGVNNVIGCQTTSQLRVRQLKHGPTRGHS